eukprot:TRINITY_DN4409_c0_g1_i1.p1 TRINITY_DN4409_c0_g1~~TRINITY_DN4409_c0_g1_i1.p1  ORF type:complete len:284 (-),score=44.46 TRINITY_DN4409_c0_g1_i1:823-1674(-)
MDRRLFLESITVFEPTSTVEAREVIFSGLCCFYSITSDRYLYFSPGSQSLDRTQMKIEISLVTLPVKCLHLVFDGDQSFLLSHYHVERLTISPAVEEAQQDKQELPPFARIVLSNIALQFYLPGNTEWVESYNKLYNTITSIISNVSQGESTTAPVVESETDLSTLDKISRKKKDFLLEILGFHSPSLPESFDGLEGQLNYIVSCSTQGNLSPQQISDLKAALTIQKEKLQSRESQLLNLLFPASVALKRDPDSTEQTMMEELQDIRKKKGMLIKAEVLFSSP